jgi:hypothetical protein
VKKAVVKKVPVAKASTASRAKEVAAALSILVTQPLSEHETQAEGEAGTGYDDLDQENC